MKKSRICRGKNGPLSEYETEWEAREGAGYTEQKYGTPMVPYQCDKCRKWHLSPKSRSTPGKECSNCGKNAYESEKGAQTRADILLKDRGVVLSVYKCPHGKGWHLTKS